MTTHPFASNRWSIAKRGSGDLYPPRRTVFGALVGIAFAMMCATANADNFANVYYSAAKDQLIVTMAYRGTNPDHTFSVKWGPCQERSGGRTVSGEVLDSQWQDEAKSAFKKTTRFSLADIPCRPAKVTLRSAPRFFFTVQIPAGASATP